MKERERERSFFRSKQTCGVKDGFSNEKGVVGGAWRMAVCVGAARCSSD